MPPLKEFTLFMELPKNVRDKIWELHRENRGVRHYFSDVLMSISESKTSRHYAALDTETNTMVRTRLSRKTLETYWDKNSRPIKGESDDKVALEGRSWIYTSYGTDAKSIITATKPTKSPPYSTATYGITLFNLATGRTHIRMNYTKDVVVFEGLYACLQRMFNPRRKDPIRWQDLEGHWLENVQHLALSIAGCRHNAEKIIATLPKLKHLYLIVQRDRKCSHGPPRGWKTFDSQRHMTKHKFMPFDLFRALHPDKAANPCECETDTTRAFAVERAFKRAFLAEYKADDVDITVVADPY
ncbi:hypothetical protein RRF57_012096 [Xylaria bambusicola]|uniref:Uncharacterized protein n=1 Tax=Xylaria bambusicola TaxID=326684 RepID=A0AAN7UXK0_9PEZI